jgi:hypothetical protein
MQKPTHHTANANQYPEVIAAGRVSFQQHMHLIRAGEMTVMDVTMNRKARKVSNHALWSNIDRKAHSRDCNSVLPAPENESVFADTIMS